MSLLLRGACDISRRTCPSEGMQGGVKSGGTETRGRLVTVGKDWGLSRIRSDGAWLGKGKKL